MYYNNYTYRGPGGLYISRSLDVTQYLYKNWPSSQYIHTYIIPAYTFIDNTKLNNPLDPS